MKYLAKKLAICPRCKLLVEQQLYDYTNKLYKCTKCKNIHP